MQHNSRQVARETKQIAEHKTIYSHQIKKKEKG